MKPYFCLIASIYMAGCVVVPVPIEQAVLDGRQYTDSDLEFVRLGTTARSEVTGNLGDPTVWLWEQRILVYGLWRVETGTFWFIGVGLTGAGGLVAGETREAVFIVLDDKDVVTNWGRVPVKRCETWRSAAMEWAASENLEMPPAHGQFVEETPATGQGLIFFYRPRDYQHFLPAVPPAKRVPLGTSNHADITQDGKLVGQIRWQTYVAVRVPPGIHRFVVNPDTDCVVNPENYRSAIIQLDVAPDTVSFVDVAIQAGLGTIEPILVNRPRSEAILAIEKLRESW
jgi:hypothetical protein